MARPTKQGVDYFPLDVHLDSKFKFVEIKYGLKGFAIIIKLLQKIYSNGYWFPFNEDEKLLFCHEINADINLVNDVINEALTRDIFDINLYKQYEILTSKGIQKRYKEMVKRRKDVEVVEEYLLINSDFGVNANIIKVNDSNNNTSSIVNDSKSTQSKVKETKVNKSKVNKTKVNKTIDTNVSMSVETDSSIIKSPIIDYSKILNYWNENSKLKEITAITERRKGHINARIKEHGIDAIYKAIDNVANSSFLRGGNHRGWMANFDWVFKPDNFVKVLEGNYLDKTPNDFENDIARRAEKIKTFWRIE